LDRPLFGGGFGTDTLNVFRRYAPTEAPFNVYTGTVWVAHNIFFQALGEHGFVGLFLFLALGLLTWRMAGSVIKRTANDSAHSAWAPLLMRMCQVSLVGYATGGSFLSLMHLDVIYYLMAVVVITDATVRESGTVRATASPVRSIPPSMVPQPPPKLGTAGQPAMRPGP
jgi:O-antigen ligase